MDHLSLVLWLEIMTMKITSAVCTNTCIRTVLPASREEGVGEKERERRREREGSVQMLSWAVHSDINSNDDEKDFSLLRVKVLLLSNRLVSDVPCKHLSYSCDCNRFLCLDSFFGKRVLSLGSSCMFICIDVVSSTLFLAPSSFSLHVFHVRYHERGALLSKRRVWCLRESAGCDLFFFFSNKLEKGKFLIRRSVSQGNKMPIKSIHLKCSLVTQRMTKKKRKCLQS